MKVITISEIDAEGNITLFIDGKPRGAASSLEDLVLCMSVWDISIEGSGVLEVKNSEILNPFTGKWESLLFTCDTNAHFFQTQNLEWNVKPILKDEISYDCWIAKKHLTLNEYITNYHSELIMQHAKFNYQLYSIGGKFVYNHSKDVCVWTIQYFTFTVDGEAVIVLGNNKAEVSLVYWRNAHKLLSPELKP